METDKIT